jgi:hypothetical protein
MTASARVKLSTTRRRIQTPCDRSVLVAAIIGEVMPNVLDYNRPRSPATLPAISEHVLYDITMFGLMTDLLTPHLWAEIPTHTAHGASNAMIELFTIHARALQDFLYATPRGDDVSAADGFPAGVWESIRGPEPGVLVDARRRTGKEIAHLTYARLERTEENKLWPHQEILDALRTPLFRFQARVNEALVCQGFKARAWMAFTTVASVPEKVRYREPGTASIVATQAFGLSSR